MKWYAPVPVPEEFWRARQALEPSVRPLRLVVTGYTAKPEECCWYEQVNKLYLCDFSCESGVPEALWRALDLGTPRVHLTSSRGATEEEVRRVCGYSHLEKLRLSCAPLPLELWRLSCLSTLELYECACTTLPPELGDLRMLEKLYLYDCPLEALPAEVVSLPRLHSLQLICCEVTALPPGVCGMPALRTLTVDDCSLRGLPLETTVPRLEEGHLYDDALPQDVHYRCFDAAALRLRSQASDEGSRSSSGQFAVGTLEERQLRPPLVAEEQVALSSARESLGSTVSPPVTSDTVTEGSDALSSSTPEHADRKRTAADDLDGESDAKKRKGEEGTGPAPTDLRTR
mmetsp:Transcript_14792/g.58025  ORF Transcript_14792/g.58025 Transcript_14792/m.58025 type:complete len:344 (-) Transcript_14792:233-1264(-)|eukprot:CAMPEP_0114622638 /NCGR_PEP_ID=MMETSP0168-20121206/9840_1 /TAXON_ID=95228 ORGANISM="Vannella sp., Strain DIVA3 517/6/12" /NCGR_SAMPLE_ID=MMETSP0168 /ASSEMBLY_ACC=CAM_ASM_000044 /LENGTH=343 /DNA_ID=CAMNT_0001833859 /DNA_START=26 /DNA_END=1057 /DNA_ORIENTATION=+